MSLGKYLLVGLMMPHMYKTSVSTTAIAEEETTTTPNPTTESSVLLREELTLPRSTVPGSTCEDYCQQTFACVNDPHKHGSYCKIAGSNPPVCFGLYWRDFERSQLCFQPNDPTCPQAFPVICPEIQTSTPRPLDTCQINCLVTPACAFNPTSQGSYCKQEQSIPVCFGLYWRTAERVESCFSPVDPTCPENIPILCG
jgi:hypothetical protein